MAKSDQQPSEEHSRLLRGWLPQVPSKPDASVSQVRSHFLSGSAQPWVSRPQQDGRKSPSFHWKEQIPARRPQLSERLRESTSTYSPDQRGLQWGTVSRGQATCQPSVQCLWLASGCARCQRCPGHNTPHLVPAPWYQATGTPPQARAPGWPTTSPAMPGVGGGARQAAGQVAEEGEEGAWKSVRPEGRRAGSARGQGHVLRPGLEGSLR